VSEHHFHHNTPGIVHANCACVSTGTTKPTCRAMHAFRMKPDGTPKRLQFRAKNANIQDELARNFSFAIKYQRDPTVHMRSKKRFTTSCPLVVNIARKQPPCPCVHAADSAPPRVLATNVVRVVNQRGPPRIQARPPCGLEHDLEDRWTPSANERCTRGSCVQRDPVIWHKLLMQGNATKYHHSF